MGATVYPKSTVTLTIGAGAPADFSCTAAAVTVADQPQTATAPMTLCDTDAVQVVTGHLWVATINAVDDWFTIAGLHQFCTENLDAPAELEVVTVADPTVGFVAQVAQLQVPRWYVTKGVVQAADLALGLAAIPVFTYPVAPPLADATGSSS